MAVNPNVARWFLDSRGITKDTLAAFNVEQDGVRGNLPVIKLPYPGATKYRKGLEKEGREFWWDPPEKHGQAMFTPPAAQGGKKMILVEGETDTMCLWQHAPQAVKPTVRGLPGTESWKDNFADDFEDAAIIYVVMDNDDPYENADAADSGHRGFKKIKTCLGPHRVRRVFLPQGTNDVCDFFSKYGWAAFKVLLDQATEVKLPYQRLDLTQPAPPIDWLVEDLVAKGDIVMLAGTHGTHKSWVALDLALGLAGLRPDWLGMKLNETGPVLYVDQENPQTVVRNRLELLGLPTGASDVQENMHYLWYQGVRLDAQAEMLYEYCEIIRPSMVVVDTLSRVHFANENLAEEMNPLLNGGVYPLARELGSAVMLLHHHAKAGGARGSTALPAATDLNLAMTPSDDSTAERPRMFLTPEKQRNSPAWGSSLLIEKKWDDPKHPTWVRFEPVPEEEDY